MKKQISHYKILNIDSVIAGTTNRFVAIKELNNILCILWPFVAWFEEQIRML